MADAAPPPSEQTPGKPAPRPGCNWHRVRVYFLSIVLMLTMWFTAAVTTVRLYPKRIIDQVLAHLPYPSSVGDVTWMNRRTLKLDNLKLDDFFYADSVIITASPLGLLRHHLAKIQILGGQLFTKPLVAEMKQMKGSGDGLDWVIGQLEISRGTVMVDDVVPGASIPLRLGVRNPIILRGLRLGKPDSSPEMSEERTVEIGNVNLVSPIDPTVPVFFFPLTRVTFTYDEIWRHHIREIDLIRPTMFLGEDLFWFSKQFKKETHTTETHGPAAPWEIAHFEVDYGRLGINAFGQPIARLPFFFETKVDNIRLDQLDRISARSTVDIRRLDQDYPDYKIRIVNLHGNLYFNLPLSDASANNVNNVIHIDELSWNNIPVKQAWASVTFDPRGVFGDLGGQCEGGLLDGNFEFYYLKGFTWNANFFAEKINCQPIAEKLVGKYCSLTGILNGKIAVQGKTTEILDCQGTLDLPNPGTLEFKSMDDLLDRLPPDTIAMKRQALQLAIDSFKTYPYLTGQVKVAYTPAGGSGVLQLDSPLGQRLFKAYWHPWAADGDGSTH